MADPPSKSFNRWHSFDNVLHFFFSAKNVKKFLKPKKNKKKGSKGGGFFHRGNKDKSPPA